jgi:hypothetical protein
MSCITIIVVMALPFMFEHSGGQYKTVVAPVATFRVLIMLMERPGIVSADGTHG